MAACDVVEGDLLDPQFRGAHAANVSAREAARADAEKAARDAGVGGGAMRAAGDAAERAAEQTPLRYTRRQVVDDASVRGVADRGAAEERRVGERERAGAPARRE
jgi:hypothetical protein